MNRTIRIGMNVKVSDGSGCLSNSVGKVVNPNRVPIGRDGIPELLGHYNRVDWKRESAIELTTGELITMFDSRLTEV